MSQDAEQSTVPATSLSLCARSLREWGSASFWSLIVLAVAWLVVLACYEMLSRDEPAFHRILSVGILGLVPAAIACVAAYAVRASFLGMSAAFDPAERSVVLVAVLVTDLVGEGLMAGRRGWPVLVARLRRAVVAGTALSGRAGTIGMRIGGSPIRFSARTVLRVLAARQRVAR